MSKYEPLGQFLSKLDARHWRPTFHELERLLEFELPASARKRAAWWANEVKGAQSQAKAWMDAGWQVERADIAKGVVSFVKKQTAPGTVAGDTLNAGARFADEAKVRARAAKDWAEDVPGRAAAVVRANPATAVGVSAGVAFAAGVVLGLLLIQRNQPSARERFVDLAEDHADDLFHRLKSKIGGLHVPDRAAAAMAQHGADDALSALREGLKNLHLPAGAAEAARAKAEDAIHLLREGLKDLRELARDRFGR